MTIRSELEVRLFAFAAAQNPPLEIATEDRAFTKGTLPFLECFLIPASTNNVTTDAKRIRLRGVFQVNVWVPSGKNKLAEGEAIAQGIIDAFPVVPKQGTVSIESTPEYSKALNDVAGWRIIPITIDYRVESKTN